MTWLWLCLPAGFLLGAVPFGYLVARAKGVDIFAVGSGNIGATNVMRTLGKGPGMLVFLLDVLKGFVPSVAVRLMDGPQELAFAAGMCAVLGHSFSPFLKFKGGKGIATGLGMLLGSTPLVAASAFATFFLVMALTLVVSISSVTAGFSVSVFGLLLGDSIGLVVAYGALGIYILVRHKANMKRLKEGTEPKFGQKPDGPPPGMKSRVIAGGLAIALAALVIYMRVSQ
jgi:glycerol-3-phosphate acyltransferase PlsY